MNQSMGWVFNRINAWPRSGLCWLLLAWLSSAACAQSDPAESPPQPQPLAQSTPDDVVTESTLTPELGVQPPVDEASSALEGLDFSDPESVLVWVNRRLQGTARQLDEDSADRLLDWVDETAPRLRLQVARDMYFGVGRLAFGVSADERVLEFLVKARQLAEGEAKVAAIQHWIGDVHAATGSFEDALEAYLSGLQVDGVDAPVRVELLLSLGDVSRRLNETDRALAYLAEAQTLAEQARVGEPLARVFLVTAAVYRQLDENERALSVYQTGLEVAERFDDPVLLAMFYNNLGNVVRDMGNYEEALGYFDEALRIARKQGSDYGVGINHINQAVVYSLQQDYLQALEKYQQAEAVLSEMDRPYEQRAVYEGFAFIYDALGQYDAAFEALMRFNELNSRVLNKEIQIASEEIQTRYETLLKDSELALQASELQQQQQKLYQAIMVIVALVVIVGGLVAFLRYRNQAFRALYLRNKELMLANARARQARRLSRDQDWHEPPGGLAVGEEVSLDDIESDERLQVLYERVVALFDEEKIYTRADLSIDEVAARLGSNRTYVSRAIALMADMSFRHFVNFYRVNEARRLLHEDKRSWSAHSLAEEVGYGSISSLYRAFDQHVGMSPSRYLDAIQADSLRTSSSS